MKDRTMRRFVISCIFILIILTGIFVARRNHDQALSMLLIKALCLLFVVDAVAELLSVLYHYRHREEVIYCGYLEEHNLSPKYANSTRWEKTLNGRTQLVKNRWYHLLFKKNVKDSEPSYRTEILYMEKNLPTVKNVPYKVWVYVNKSDVRIGRMDGSWIYLFAGSLGLLLLFMI